MPEHTDGTTNGRNGRWSDAPWWAQFIKTVGVYAAVMLGLLAFILNAWTEDRNRMTTTLQDQTNAIISIRENLLLHAQDVTYLVKSVERIHSVNMAGCLNSATDERQRQRCVEGNR